MSAVLRVTIEVGRRCRAISDAGQRAGDGIGLYRDAGQRLLGRSGPDRGWSHVRQAKPGLGNGAAFRPDGCRDAGDRPLLSDPDELLVRRAPAGVFGYPDLDQDLVIAKCSRKEILEEVSGCDPSLPTRTGDHELSVQSQHWCG